ncbi:MAG: hypothetical protein CIT02_02320 [Methanobacterium sp. BAmetb5]|nr:MAG: hypothetical protein CIT02_02320 [Methanobacterium sp. BAmetb5]
MNRDNVKIGIYAPDLSAYGGGEKYICKIAEILAEKNDVEFIVFEKPNVEELESRLNVDLQGVNIRKFELNYFVQVLHLHKHVKAFLLKKITKQYDIFINQDINTVIPANSSKNFYICQIPPTNIKRSIFERVMARTFLDQNLKTYDKIVVYSTFVKKWIEKYFDNKIEILNPPVDIEKFHPGPKENKIVSVGRFFTGAHSKKQLDMIKIFKELYDNNKSVKNWEYHLAGGVGDISGNKEYLRLCQEESKGYPIHFHVNTSLENLIDLYSRSKIFWHATGFNEDENKNPEIMEHFGITTGEAMSAGCVPVVINKGGQPEIVRDGVDGFVWNDSRELKEITLKIITDEYLLKEKSYAAIMRIKEFGMDNFVNNTKKLFNFKE